MEHTLTTSELKGTIKINVDDFNIIKEEFIKHIDDFDELKSLCFSSDNSDYLVVNYYTAEKDLKSFDFQKYSLQNFLSLFRKHETIIENNRYS